MKQNIIIVLLTLVFCGIGLAGETQTISVSNAVDLALKNNLQLKQMQEDLAIAKAQMNQSFADFALPKISANASFTLLDPGTVSNGVFAIPGYPIEFTNVFPDNYSGGISISKTLFSGFRLWNSLRVKQISFDLMKMKFEDKKREVVYSTLTSFYNLFLLRERIKLSEEQDENLSNQVRNIQLNVENGSASQYEKVRVNVLFKLNQPKLITSRNAYQTYKVDFCNFLGLKSPDSIEFTGSLMDYTNLTEAPISETDALVKAESNDINLRTLDDTIEMLKLGRNISDGARYPSLSAAFNMKEEYAKYNMIDPDRTWVPSWTLGLQLSIPIDDWLPISKTANTVNEADANIRKTVFARQQAAENLALSVKSVLLQLEVSKINVASQAEALSQAKLALDLANKRYEAGAGLVSDIDDSELSYSQAQDSYLQATFDYYSSTLKLKRLTGE